MRGDGVVLLLVCLSLLGGVVVGLRFNVRMLVLTCLATLVIGSVWGFGGPVGFGHGLLMGTVSIVALQVGYFIALLIAAMRLADDPEPLGNEVSQRRARVRASRL